MGNLFINHRRCPDCGNHIKHYYWYCGRCGNQDLTNWLATAVLAVAFIAILIIGAFFVRKSLCSSTITAQIVNSAAPALACK